MTSTTGFDARAFRDLGGRFATGVTVITTSDRGGRRAMTANAVSTVSLDPPLMLVCVQRTASIHEAIARAGHFAINILAEDQGAISARFAQHGEFEEPMGGIPFRAGQTGTPLLEGTLGWFECEVWQPYDGGDHTIYVGRVVAMELTQPEGRPLLFFAGGYGELAPPPDAE